MLYDDFSYECSVLIEQIRNAIDKRSALIFSAKLEELKSNYYTKLGNNKVHAIKVYNDFYNNQARNALLRLAVIRDKFNELTGTEIEI